MVGNSATAQAPTFAMSLALEQEQSHRARGPEGARRGGDSAIQAIGLLQGRGCRATLWLCWSSGRSPLQLSVLCCGAAAAGLCSVAHQGHSFAPNTVCLLSGCVC